MKSTTKYIYTLKCRKCCKCLTEKSMRSVLISNNKIKLFSTNYPTDNIKKSGITYRTKSCLCLISNVICKICNIILGYTILAPCDLCLQNKNNGHLWMFSLNKVYYDIILQGNSLLIWKINECNDAKSQEIKIR
ncbi:protein fam72a [Vairimorpha ceranae]|uniref:Protein fam72a n=1 Tax=Vairimorpha ceranae TaxID=40302 RepID=A0A0F9WF81_9MICR|nr:protein fam72a [Vairimorpha ceranae]KAF5140697.1 hypothetical protein G9O61_00g011930 [Vairimorpha ceranae]KKO76001.1 protein fam72a [Vairimorpha ceranae]